MTSPVSSRPGSGYTFSRPELPQLRPTIAPPAGHQQVNLEGSAGRLERNLLRENMGVDRFDPSTNRRAPGGQALRAIPTVAQGSVERRGSVGVDIARGEVAALGITRDVEARALVAAGQARARYQVGGSNGVQAEAGATASAMLGEVRVRTPGPNGREVGSAFVGATAGATGTLSLNPRTGDYRVGVSTDNFIGARATGEARFEHDLGSVTGRLTVQAGIGLNARIEGGLQNNRLSYRVELGAALGIGGRVGFTVDVDMNRARETAGRAAAAVADQLRDTRLGRGASAVGDFLRSRGVPLPG